MVPQTSPTATTDTFTSTYDGLQDKFATIVSETDKGLKVMSQQVREDASMLGLVGQLRNGGPWATNHLDTIGMQSAANQGFALWVYSTLMPTLYERYHVTNCRNGFHWSQYECTPPTGAGVLGASDPTPSRPSVRPIRPRRSGEACRASSTRTATTSARGPSRPTR